MTDLRVTNALIEMRMAFPGATANSDTLKLYARKLSDLDPDMLIAAIDRLVNTAQPKYHGYFPSIAEIREMVVAGGPTDGAAELAWSEVLREAQRVGWNNKGYFANGVHHDPPKPEFTSPITIAAVESVTWRAICLSEKQEQVRSDFLWAWKNLASRMLKQAQNGDAVDVIGDTNLRMIGKTAGVA